MDSLNDICDIGNDYVTWCYTTVLLQMADMTRKVMTRQKAASPGEIFAEAGGYFAIVQFVCWIASGMAFQ
ncbi:Uu.00g003420.m01.CDS01 [Anthostomella pinea]|uniref:Uu.00g003420.m01.CDS01 n=1 Tax=Anthostomella pinea TaxID=933095 RepID=A0AAI8YIQ7_9PEZI|nr:Uu.00g003420.m01.CDS01 [Anthostomella pinea]